MHSNLKTLIDSATFTWKNMHLMLTVVRYFLIPSKKQLIYLSSIPAPITSWEEVHSHVTTLVSAPSTISIIEIPDDHPMTASSQSNHLDSIDIPMDPSHDPPHSLDNSSWSKFW